MRAGRRAGRAAPGIAASLPLDAFAHGNVAISPWLDWLLLVVFLGLIACFVVPFLVTFGQGMIWRIVAAIVLPVFAGLTWYGLLFILLKHADYSTRGVFALGVLTLYTWIVAAVYAVVMDVWRWARSG